MLFFYFLLLLNNNYFLPLISLTVIYSLITLVPSKAKASQKLSKWNYIYQLLALYLLFNSISKIAISNDLLPQPAYNHGLLVHARLTSEEKDLLLKLHQKTRKDVGASNMQPLEWSSTLASEAQEYADECHGMVHSGVMGENLAAATYNDVEKLYYLWEDERDDFERSDSNRKKFPGGSFGHYSQVVWASNTKVGCGYSNCESSNLPYYLVCRYEVGNILGYEVYSYSSSSAEKPNISSNKSSSKHESHESHTTTHNKHTTTHAVTKTSASASKPTSKSDIESNSNSHSNDSSSSSNRNEDSNTTTTINTSIGNIDIDTNVDANINDEDEDVILIENNDSPINNGNIDDNRKEDNGDAKDDNDSHEDATVGDSVNVVAEDDGNGGIIFVVLSGTAVSGAFALFYVKKKKPEQYQKLLRQVSQQQKQIGKITKKLTVKVSRGTTTIGKMIERSRTTTTMSGRQIRKPSIFKRSKSMNDKNNHGAGYRFTLSFYDDLNTDNIDHDDWDYYRSLSKQNDAGNYTAFPISQNNYRKLSDHEYGNTSYEKNNDPVPNPKTERIEKMNNTLDKYDYYLANNGNDYFSRRTGDAYGRNNYERKDSIYSIEKESSSSNRKKDTYYNVLGNYYEHPSSVVVINPEVRPPVPARFRSSNDRDN